MQAIAEISGADSIAAALTFVSENPSYTELLPTYVGTGTEFGDFSAIEDNVSFLRAELHRRHGVRLLDLERFEDPAMWRAINGRFASVLMERYGRWLPCVGCHLYLHVMRVPVCDRAGLSVVISGEREHHDARRKANQSALVLDAYASVMAYAGVELAFPVRHVTSGRELDGILGDEWPGGSPQLQCVLSGNERTVEGACGPAAGDELIQRYIEPVGRAVIDEMRSGGSDWEAAVAGVLRAP
jgi:hypothetical protein